MPGSNCCFLVSFLHEVQYRDSKASVANTQDSTSPWTVPLRHTVDKLHCRTKQHACASSLALLLVPLLPAAARAQAAGNTHEPSHYHALPDACVACTTQHELLAYSTLAGAKPTTRHSPQEHAALHHQPRPPLTDTLLNMLPASRHPGHRQARLQALAGAAAAAAAALYQTLLFPPLLVPPMPVLLCCCLLLLALGLGTDLQVTRGLQASEAVATVVSAAAG